jgi:AraC family cel operon transcriptional repressor
MCYFDKMEFRTLTDQSYLRQGEAFHFARRTLDQGPIRILHDHDYFELFWIDHGRANHLINGDSVSLSAGDGALIRPEDRHAFSRLGAEPCRLVNIMFRAETAAHLLQRYGEDFADRYFWVAGEAPCSLRLDPTQQSSFDNLVLDLEMGPRTRVRLEAFLLILLTKFMSDTLEPRETIPPWLSAALRSARQPEIFRQGAQGLIVAAGRSHEHVCRSLKEHLGLTPSAFVNKIRMEHAARLLACTDLSVPDVAAECGLENMSHFHMIFRDCFGVTPRRYRGTRQGDPVQPESV